MSHYDYQVAKNILTDKDKERLICLYFSRGGSASFLDNVDWDKATTDFQCASVSSMKTMTYGMLKKIENAGGKVGASASATPKKSGGKKRKATPMDDDEEEATPTVKKGRKSKKKAATPVDSTAEDETEVKGEPVSDGQEEAGA